MDDAELYKRYKIRVDSAKAEKLAWAVKEKYYDDAFAKVQLQYFPDRPVFNDIRW